MKVGRRCEMMLTSSVIVATLAVAQQNWKPVKAFLKEWRDLIIKISLLLESKYTGYPVIYHIYSLEVLMLKLKLQYLGHLIQRVDSLENTLMLGKTEGKRRRGQLRMRWLNSMSLSKLWEILKDRDAWGTSVHGVTKRRTWLSKWTTTTSHLYPLQIFSPVYCLSFESMLVPTEYLNNQNVI